MTYVPHHRLTMSGTFAGGEIFSMNLALAQIDNNGGPLVLEPTADVWDDVADDCAAWFGREATGIGMYATLRKVKIAPIGADGKYTGIPVERERVVAGGAFVNAGKAYQVARVVTLHTAADLGRIKGRFYVPYPMLAVDENGRWAAAAVDAAEASDKTFLENLANQPGLDVLGLKVVVASQGRFTRTGFGTPVQRVAPGNHVVTGVSVGRVPDTQRRRRNKLAEARTLSSISQGS